MRFFHDRRAAPRSVSRRDLSGKSNSFNIILIIKMPRNYRIRSRGKFKNRSPSPPRQPTPPSIVNRYKNVIKNRIKIVDTLRSMPGNYYFWSQRKHVEKISFLMNAHEMSAEAAIYSYKTKHYAPT